MYTEEGEVVAPMPSRGRRGALTMEVLTRCEALEKTVNELLEAEFPGLDDTAL